VPAWPEPDAPKWWSAINAREATPVSMTANAAASEMPWTGLSVWRADGGDDRALERCWPRAPGSHRTHVGHALQAHEEARRRDRVRARCRVFVRNPSDESAIACELPLSW